MSELALARWGDLRLFCSQVSTDGGRTQVVHEPSSGDSHVIQDRGLRVRRARCRLQFDEFPGFPPPIDAARALEDAKNTGAVQMFSHPLLGRYLASVGEFTSEINESGLVTGEVEFIQESDNIAITPAGAASSGISGEASVSSAAENLDFELAAIGALKMSGPTASSVLSRTLQGGGAGLGVGFGFGFNMSVSASVDFSVTMSANIAASATASARASADASATAAAQVNVTASAQARAAASATATAFVGVAVGASASAGASFDASAGGSDLSAELAVAATTEASIGLFAALTIDARVAVSSWQDGEVSPRRIAIDAARISDNIATAIDVGRLEYDLSLWAAYRAMIMLGDAVRSAAIAVTSQAPSVFLMRVESSTALLALAARVYGGADAVGRSQQIATLNDIATPGWLTPGDYIMPARGS